MKTLDFNQMERIEGGWKWSYLNPFPTNGCEFALGGVAGVYAGAIAAFATAGISIIAAALTIAANAICDR